MLAGSPQRGLWNSSGIFIPMRTIGPGLRRVVTLVPLSGEGDLPRPIYSRVVNALGAKWRFLVYLVLFYILD